jgi:hypothetical protein
MKIVLKNASRRLFLPKDLDIIDHEISGFSYPGLINRKLGSANSNKTFA